MYQGVLPESEQEAPADTSFAHESVFAPSLWEIGLCAYLKDLCVCVCVFVHLKRRQRRVRMGVGRENLDVCFFQVPPKHFLRSLNKEKRQ